MLSPEHRKTLFLEIVRRMRGNGLTYTANPLNRIRSQLSSFAERNLNTRYVSNDAIEQCIGGTCVKAKPMTWGANTLNLGFEKIAERPCDTCPYTNHIGGTVY